MNDEDFAGLLQSVDEARAFARGDTLAGMKVHSMDAPDIAAIRKRTGLSQTAFSRSIGVSPATLRNWEQGRRSPDGPARILLSLLARDPEIVRRTLERAA